MAVLGPTSRPSDDIANGRVARELPVASALPIRQDLAHIPALVIQLVPRPEPTFYAVSWQSALQHFIIGS